MSTDLPGDPLEPVAERTPDSQATGENGGPAALGRRGPTRWSLNSAFRKFLVRPAGTGTSSDKAFGSGLDEREHRFSVAATVLALGLVTAGYIVDRHSAVLKVRDEASTLLIAGLILVAIMFAGIIFRRGSMVGIASFMMGFELITAADIFGALFLVFGSWLLVRGMRRQRTELAAGTRPTRSAKTTPVRPAGSPKPSKRYTPPRRSRTATRRR